ncbi:GlcG/HbpS family heme-binding protein [Sneathiella sp.]|uniref:GlcG/HbpS family heme-binding protein n=1 Tax=Sneathiella sp. TaxID=1964365 RepID=UPI0039E550AD
MGAAMTTSAMAADLPTAPYLPLDMAQKAANAAIQQCKADGFNVSVAIVARSGETKVLLKADGSGPHTVGSSTGKAFTSASMGRPTMGLAMFLKDHRELDGLRDMDSRLVILGGGLPIKINGALVGGIGVGGAPGGDKDEKCAKVGLAAIGAE